MPNITITHLQILHVLLQHQDTRKITVLVGFFRHRTVAALSSHKQDFKYFQNSFNATLCEGRGEEANWGSCQ